MVRRRMTYEECSLKSMVQDSLSICGEKIGRITGDRVKDEKIATSIMKIYFKSVLHSMIYGYKFIIPYFGRFSIERKELRDLKEIRNYTKRYSRKYGEFYNVFNPKAIGYSYRSVFEVIKKYNNPRFYNKDFLFKLDVKIKKKLRDLLVKDDLHYEYEQENINKKRTYSLKGRNRCECA